MKLNLMFGGVASTGLTLLIVYQVDLLLVFQGFGITIPSSPGFIGTYHAAVVAGLAVFGISYELAIGVAIIMHAAFFLPFIVLGLVFLWTEHVSLQEVWSVKAKNA